MRTFGTFITVFLFGLLSILSGCEDPNPVELVEEDTLSFEERLALEEDTINQLIVEQGFDSVFVTSTGLRIIPINEGNGKATQFGDILTLDLIGSLLDGIIFEATDEDIRNDVNYFGSGRETPVRNLPDGVAVSGFNEGLTFMEEGSSVILLLPSNLAFGSLGNIRFNVGPNRIVRFDITLLKIRR